MIPFNSLHPRAADLLGWIPQFLSEADPRPVREQFNEAYAHGGGWNPFEGFEFDPETLSITYPGDPAYFPIAKGVLRGETILVYPNAWVCILQPNGTHEIARMD